MLKTITIFLLSTKKNIFGQKVRHKTQKNQIHLPFNIIQNVPI